MAGLHFNFFSIIRATMKVKRAPTKKLVYLNDQKKSVAWNLKEEYAMIWKNFKKHDATGTTSAKRKRN